MMDREDVLLLKYGANPKEEYREELIELLKAEIANEEKLESHECLRVLCFQLFSLGKVEDSELIWKAKMQNMDTGCMVDTVLLCGAGYKETLSYIENRNDLKKMKEFILDYVGEEFDKNEVVEEFKEYYKVQ